MSSNTSVSRRNEQEMEIRLFISTMRGVEMIALFWGMGCLDWGEDSVRGAIIALQAFKLVKLSEDGIGGNLGEVPGQIFWSKVLRLAKMVICIQDSGFLEDGLDSGPKFRRIVGEIVSALDVMAQQNAAYRLDMPQLSQVQVARNTVLPQLQRKWTVLPPPWACTEHQAPSQPPTNISFKSMAYGIAIQHQKRTHDSDVSMSRDGRLHQSRLQTPESRARNSDDGPRSSYSLMAQSSARGGSRLEYQD